MFISSKASPAPKPAAALGFSYDGFRELIADVRAHGYVFARLDEPIDAGKVFYLRHDVDISPNCALRLGRIASDLGVRSNIFFQLNADTYNAFSPATLNIIGELRGAGHCVGLHVDERLIGCDLNKVQQTLRWFSECCAPIDHIVSFHRPTEAVLGRDFSGFVNAYAPRFWGEDRYLSDSRRSPAFRSTLADWLARERAPIQLLLHPEWWHPHHTAHEIWEDLRARRQHELERYVVENFRKVFMGVVEPRDRPTGV